MQTRSDIDGTDPLARTAVYGALATGFGPLADDAGLTRLWSDAGWGRLGGALGLLGLDVDLDSGDGERTPDRIRDRHADLFGHTVRSPVPPYETEYGTDTLFQQPVELADIAAFLSAFGLVVDGDAHERVDHVRMECEMMAFLACKEAHATQTGDDEMLEATLSAQRLFLRDHLGRFTPAFVARLEAADGEGFYAALGRVLRAIVAHDCDRFEIDAGLPELALRAPADEGVPMACGSESGCDSACPE